MSKNKHLQKKAHAEVVYCIKKGDITRLDTCENCFESCRPDAHHVDYLQPLKIVWLCSKCHFYVEYFPHWFVDRTHKDIEYKEKVFLYTRLEILNDYSVQMNLFGKYIKYSSCIKEEIELKRQKLRAAISADKADEMINTRHLCAKAHN